MRQITFLILSLFILNLEATTAQAASDQKPPREMVWSFDGPLGRVDKQSAQRGLQVYQEVCAICHSLRLVSFRTLTELGFSVDEVKAIAAQYTIIDGPNDEGEMFERPGKPSDSFPSPFANKQAGQAIHGAYPPDMSLLIKARPDGANYMYSLLTGYGSEPPEDFEMVDGASYNPYFPGGLIKMPPPLSEDQVTYADGTKASVSQMSRDVTNFLQWTAEPEMEERKNMGIQTLLFLLAFTIFFYKVKTRIWGDVE